MPSFTEPRRLALATLPTPLSRLTRLEAQLGGGCQIWVKRDDLTGLEFSGNKIRKLEYIAAAAITEGFDTLVTEGTCQSNHCRATAAVCARLGLHARLLFRPLPPPEIQGNQFLDGLFGAEWRSYSREAYSPNRDSIIEATLAELRAAGRRPRFTPAGASEPLGCFGYIRAAGELAAQLREAGISEADVVVGVSSGGTYAGLLLGRLLHATAGTEFWGVPVSDDVAYHTREIAALCRAAIEQFRLPVDWDEALMHYLGGYVGEGYAIPYAEAVDTLRMLARVEGLLLDPVYTAKAFWALVDGANRGRFGRKRPVVFIHTGGAFSNFAWTASLLPR